MSVALSIDPCEVQIKAIRAQGPGGQNVHKVATAVQLFFDIRASSLPQEVKERCLALADQRPAPEITHLFSPTLVRRHSVMAPSESDKS